MFSLWKKIFAAIIFVSIALFGINELLKKADGGVGLVTTRFIQKRNEVAGLLKQLASTPDTNLTELGSYEQRRDYLGALNILRGVQNKNDELVGLIGDLVLKTEAVTAEAEKIDEVVLRPQAISALEELQRGNNLMLDYFEFRTQIFQKMNKYYSDFVLTSAATPPDITADMEKIDQYVAEARLAYDSFNKKIDLFDRAAGLK